MSLIDRDDGEAVVIVAAVGLILGAALRLAGLTGWALLIPALIGVVLVVTALWALVVREPTPRAPRPSEPPAEPDPVARVELPTIVVQPRPRRRPARPVPGIRRPRRRVAGR